MATDKKRLTISLDDDLLEKVLQYQDDKKLKTQSSAIVQLLELGMTALDISPVAKNDSKIEKKYAELDKYGRSAVDTILDIEHSRGQRFDPAYLHQTDGRESLENTKFSRLFRFSSKIQKRIKKECYCILGCILFWA